MTKRERVMLNAMKRRMEKFNRKETVGKLSADLLKNNRDIVDPIEQQREMQKDYLNNLVACIKENKHKFHDDFYVEVITKNEKLMTNVIRNYFAARQTCPSPRYDQSVYRYSPKDEHIQYIWTVPCWEACQFIRENAQYALPEEREMVMMVLKFYDGSLLALAKKLNQEEESHIIA